MRPHGKTLDDVLDNYTPTCVPTGRWAATGDFTCESVRRATDRVRMAIKLRVAAARYVAWAHHDAGLPLTDDAIWLPDNVERFIATQLDDVTEHSRTEYASSLRHISRRLLPHHQPIAVTHSYQQVSDAYRPQVIDGYLQLADNQPTASKRVGLTSALCLGLGVGLDGRENHLVHPKHVKEVGPDRVRVEVEGGRRDRTVPLLPRYAPRLVWAKHNTPNPDRPLVDTGGDMYRLVSGIAGGSHLPALKAGRMRSTWMTTVAQLNLPVAALLEMAGVTTLRSFEEALKQLRSFRLEDVEAVLQQAHQAEHADRPSDTADNGGS